MLSTAEAIDRLLALARVTGTETVPLAEAAGRVLAADAVARRTQPPFPASAMDGYAVRAAEAVAGAVLDVAGEAQAGRAFGGALPPGAAIRIFTGAPVPEGADAILIQENATRDGDRITVTEAPAEGEYVRPAGTDFRAGATLAAPRRLTASDVALLAAMNIPEVTVARRPVVALIPTGDELVMPGEEPGPDQIVASNNFGLAAMLAAAGAEPRMLPIARDTEESLRARLDEAAGADLIVTIGGASVGDHDLVQDVAGAAGLDLSFYKIAMRPGKPLMAGRLGGAALVGLPGNPVSAMVCGEIFLRPLLDAMLGLPGAPRAREVAILAEPLGPNGPREHYMRATLTGTADGRRICRVAPRQDSSLLSVLATANALAVRPPHAPAAEAGETVEVIPLA